MEDNEAHIPRPATPASQTEAAPVEHGRPGVAYERGSRVDRYVILDRLDQGGMGVVYRALDPELGRPVALKLLTADRAAGATHGSRLLREAQALARLSHPNVVAVFDVGTIDGQVFIATEFVEGLTLERWLEHEPRGRREILQVFLAAGEGLAAVHQAGLVHRDFKPDNVMVGNDGRVRVVDFGLVRTTASEAGSNDSAAAAESEASTVDSEPASSGVPLNLASSADRLTMTLTRAGSIMGTPSFMAPEQHQRSAVDERADQYGFCVSLYRALYGAPPFSGDTLDELRENVLAGRVADPPPGTGVPRWLRRVLLRGLATAPDDRFPTLDRLLAALRADPSATRLRLARYAVVLGIMGAALFGWRAQHEKHAQPCRGVEERLTGVWDFGIKTRVRSAFLASGAPYAKDTYSKVSDILDHYATQWVTTRTDACEATQLRGEQSAELMDLRMQCLDRRAAEFSALTSLFAQAPNRSVLDRSVEAATGLRDLGGCDREAVMTAHPLPSDPELRARIAHLRSRLGSVEALEGAGQYREGLDQVNPLVTEARETGHAPVEAEATLLLGRLQNEVRDPAAAEKTLHEAMLAAARAHDDGRFAGATIELVDVVGRGLDRPLDGVALHPMAESALLCAGDPLKLRTQFFMRTIKVLLLAGKSDDAIEMAARAVALSERATAPDSLETAQVLRSQASGLMASERYEPSIQVYQRALSILEARLGPQHPEVVRTLLSIADAYESAGMHERAAEVMHDAVAIAEQSFDEESGEIGEVHLRVAGVFYGQGDLAQSEGSYRRALATFEKAHGPESRRVGMVLYNMSDTLRAQGRSAEARAICERALSIFEEKKTLGPNHSLIGLSIECIGSTLREEGRPVESIPFQQRALAFFEQSAPDSTRLAYVSNALALTYLALGRPADAKPLLERAVEIYEEKQADRGDKGTTRFALAQALWLIGGDRGRALALARRAREDYMASGPLRAKELSRVDTWLRARSRPR